MLLAGLISAGCGTVKIGGHPVIETTGEKDGPGLLGSKITVNHYSYQAQPQQTPPGTPPTPPQTPTETKTAAQTLNPPPAPYQLVYNQMEDPTIRAFVNQSPNAVRLQIDDGKEFKLAAYQSTADIAFKPGIHRVKVIIERPTANFGVLEIPRFLEFSVRPEDRWQPIYVAY